MTDPSSRLKKADYYLDRIYDAICMSFLMGLMWVIICFLVPGLQVKFALWFAAQDEEFYKSDGMWQNLLKDMCGLTPEQIEAVCVYVAVLSPVTLFLDHTQEERIKGRRREFGKITKRYRTHQK